MATTLFTRTAYYLDDLAEIYSSSIVAEDGSAEDDVAKMRLQEILRLKERILELNGEWEAITQVSGPVNTAMILCALLKDWGIPGAIWFLPRTRRFRLTGEHYSPAGKSERLVGVYMPDVPPEALADDIEEVMKA